MSGVRHITSLLIFSEKKKKHSEKPQITFQFITLYIEFQKKTK